MAARGGLGIRSAVDLALPAYLSSVHGAGWGEQKLLPLYITDNPTIEEAETLWMEKLNNNGLTMAYRQDCASPLGLSNLYATLQGPAE